MDQTTVNMAVSAIVPSTSYVSVGFSPSLNMVGDAIIAMGGGVNAFTLTGFSTPTINKPVNYMTSHSSSYVNGVLTFKFSRTLAAPNGNLISFTFLFPRNS